MVSNPAAFTALISSCEALGLPHAVSLPMASSVLPRFQPAPIFWVSATLESTVPASELDELLGVSELEDSALDESRLEDSELASSDELDDTAAVLELLLVPPELPHETSVMVNSKAINVGRVFTVDSLIK